MDMRKFIYINDKGQSLEFSERTRMYVTDIDGLSSNQVTVNESYVANQIGTTIISNKIEAKDLQVEGIFKYDSEIRKKILSTILPGIKATLRYIDEKENIDVYIVGWPTTTPDISWDRTWQNFSMTFHIPYPYWQMFDQQSISFVKYESLFKFPYTFSSTVRWKISSKSIIQLTNIVNEGSVDVGFVARFIAKDTVKGPQLLKVDTQEVLEFPELVMNVGDILTISTVENDRFTRLIHDDDSEENVFYYTSFDSTFFKLSPGSNPIRFDAEEGVNNLEVDMNFYVSFAGV